MKLWFADVGETFPLKKFPLSLQFSVIGVLITSGIICAWQTIMAFRNVKNDESRTQAENWSLLFSVLSILIAMTYFFQMRVMVHAMAIGIIALTPFIAKVFEKRGILYALIALIILGPFSAPAYVMAASKIETKINTDKKSNYTFDAPPKCRAQYEFAHLANLPKGLVATNISLGIETLLSTHHDVMATHFHRDKGRDKLFPIFLSHSDQSEGLLRANHVDYIAYCKTQTEVANFQKYDPEALLSRISNSNIPKYLKPIPKPENSDIYVFEVVK